MSKITEKELRALICSITYQVVGTMTIAVAELKSGYKVVGKSACMNPDDFNEHLGRKFALEDAVNQLWDLEGYHRMAKEVGL